MKISIIIPVGNREQWRTCEEALRVSLEAYQGNVESEIIACFDDEHNGVAWARNQGLTRAQGDWICWVDCDDIVERDWFTEIAEAIVAHPDCDVIQFNATEVKDGVERRLDYRWNGKIEGVQFALEMLRHDGMPAWLWVRAFRKSLFDGRKFHGCNKEDYLMYLEILPLVRAAWSIGKPIYRYIRHGHGLSNYTQNLDYKTLGIECCKRINLLPKSWRGDALMGFAIIMADVALHTFGDKGAVSWVRRFLWRVLFSKRVTLRMKVKCILAALGIAYKQKV